MRKHRLAGAGLTAAVLLLPGLGATGQVEKSRPVYRSIELDGRGALIVITTTTGRIIRPPRHGGQVAFAQAEISPDRRSVGWTALHPNCCTEYPVPLKLIVVTAGVAHSFVGNGLPIWRWGFMADGRRVAFRQGVVHGAAPSHFELHDVETGRLVGSFDENGDANAAMPRWARAVR